MRIKFAGLLLIACLIAPPCWGVSHWITPEGDGDFPSIQAAVDAAADGDTISLADGVHKLQTGSGVYIYGKELVIRSLSGDPDLCRVEAFSGLSGRGFTFAYAGGREGVLEGLTVMNAREGFGAAVRLSNSSPTIRNCILRDNEAFGSGGGGIWVGNSSHPLIEDCHIHHNQAYGGAGIQLISGSIEVYSCVIEHNSAAGHSQTGGGD